MPELTDQERKWIEEMIRKSGLNEYGDPKGTVYAGGTPLFDERSGDMIDRFQYILRKHKDWLPR